MAEKIIAIAKNQAGADVKIISGSVADRWECDGCRAHGLDFSIAKVSSAANEHANTCRFKTV